MSPTVEAAIIAGCFGIVTLAGTVIAQLIGFRSTKANTTQQINATHRDTAATLRQQREHLDKTLTEQSEQLDRTLAAQRTRTLNERFATAADRLGSDKPPAVRLAGVYAMAGLADDWKENQQTCVDVLCAYLRMPYEPDPGPDAPGPARLAFLADSEVRQTVIRVITAHLQEEATRPWHGVDFDFTGVVFDSGDFRKAVFSGGYVSFAGAQFPSGVVSFANAKFSGGHVTFAGAQFSGGQVRFDQASFSAGAVDFVDMRFNGGVVRFFAAKFSGSEVDFGGAEFSRGLVSFDGAKFTGGKVSFLHARKLGADITFFAARRLGGEVDLGDVDISDGQLD